MIPPYTKPKATKILTKAKMISLYQPIRNNKSILTRGKTPLGRSMKKITPTVLRINQTVPLIISCENNGNPGISYMTRASGIRTIPSLIISSGKVGTIEGPFHPPRNNTTKSAAKA